MSIFSNVVKVSATGGSKSMRIADLTTIGKRLEQAQKAREIPLEKILRECEISRGAWYDWTAGRSKPNSIELCRVALYLGKTPNEILLDDGGSNAPELSARDGARLENIRRQLIELALMLPDYDALSVFDRMLRAGLSQIRDIEQADATAPKNGHKRKVKRKARKR